MKALINVTIDHTVDFKFYWSEKGSVVSHVGTVIPEDQRNKFSGVVRLGASKAGKSKAEEKPKYYDQVIVPKWLKAAIDYSFIITKVKCGMNFSVECNDMGTEPVVTILNDGSDMSWMDKLPGAKKASKPLTTEGKNAAKELAKLFTK